MKNSRSVVAFLLLALMHLSGCAGKIEDLSGTYEGDFSRTENGVTKVYRVSTTITEANWRDGEFSVTVMNRDTQKELGIIVIEERMFKHYLRSPLLAGDGEIEIEDRGTCGDKVEEKPGSVPQTTFCAQEDVISFFSTDEKGKYRVMLYMSKNGAERSDPLVPNGKFTLQDIFRRVLTSSYETRIAAEKLTQAHQEVKMARSRLLPSIGAMSIYSFYKIPSAINDYNRSTSEALTTNVMTANYLTILQNSMVDPLTSGSLYKSMAVPMIGTLVPFIFPTYWFEFNRQKSVYEGEVMGYQSLVATQMNMAEDLYHEILKDRKILALTEDVQKSLYERRDIIEERVLAGLSPEKDLEEIKTAILRNQNDITRLKRELTSQYAMLSRGVGLSPRGGVKDLADRDPFDPADLEYLDADKLMAEAKSSSLEIRQTHALKRAAQIQKNGTYFSVINPSSVITFSEGIVHQVKIAKSSLREVDSLRILTESKIEEEVIVLTEKYNDILEQSRNILPLLNLMQIQLAEAELLHNAGTISTLQYRMILANHVQLQMEKINLDSELAAVIGKKNRLLWRAPYTKALMVDIPRSTF